MFQKLMQSERVIQTWNFLLIDGNLWLPDTEEEHLLKLQEKLNNYIYFLESKQYVERYGDKFDKKVIHITFRYSPSDNGLAFLAAVQKVLQPTDMSLKVEFTGVIKEAETMLAIFIDSIGDKSGTYKLLRNYSSLPFSLIQSRIEDHDTVIEVDMLDLDELKKVRALIHELSAIGTMVTMRDSTGIITLEF